MKLLLYFVIFLFACNFLCCQAVQAQNFDINFVRSVNSDGQKSILFRGLSASVYSTSFVIPTATFIYGNVKKNRAIKIRSYEEYGSVIIAATVTGGLKTIFNRERPYEKYGGVYPFKYETGQSLPSSHAALSFAMATTLSLQYKKWYVVMPAYVWATGCSFSRIYLGEHYPTDVLAGAAIGTGSAFLSRWLTKKVFQ